MPSAAVVKAFCRELLVSRSSVRVAEPDLVMDNPENVAAYLYAGREDGSLQPIYLFQCAQACEVIKPGDTVVDLGCGPATQLAMIARLNPDSKFLGVDLSSEMLEKGEEYIKSQKLGNVEFKQADISDLTSSFQDKSVDAVVSTLAFHHLPDLQALNQTFAEIRRILKQDGGLYIADLGHMKSEASIRDFAYQYADSQPDLFIEDYLNSLRAAFFFEDVFQAYEAYLSQAGKFYKTFVIPYMLVVKSAARRTPDMDLIRALSEIKKRLPANQLNDLKDLTQFFRFGGLKSSFLRDI